VRAGALTVSLPDAFAAQGDLEVVIASVRTL
jgi:hypothetical protein